MRVKWKGWDNPCCFSLEKLEKNMFSNSRSLKVGLKGNMILFHLSL